MWCGSDSQWQKVLTFVQNFPFLVKFIYSEKAKNFCKTSTVDLTYVVTVKSTVEILQTFMTFSEYMNFKFANLQGEVKLNILDWKQTEKTFIMI